MIRNDRQYKLTKSQVEKFRQAISGINEIELVRKGIDPLIVDAQRRALESQLSSLEEQVARYEKLKSGTVRVFSAENLAELGDKLIEGRISRGLTQREFSQRLGLKEQQVQRYEQERYQQATLARICDFASSLDLKFHIECEALPEVKPVSHEWVKQFDARRLPAREMKKRGWLTSAKDGSSADVSDVELAFLYVSNFAARRGPVALHRKNVRTGSVYNEYSLAAWEARILHKASELRQSVQSYTPLDAAFVKELVELSREPDGPLRAIRALAERGVIVVFERHLLGTHLDGAALLLDGAIPVIGMTLRHDRLDNFWFTLLHEVAHIVLHRDQGLETGFFDDSTVTSQIRQDAEADQFAENALIPTEIWKSSFVRFTNSAEQVVRFANKYRIGDSIVAGRIRRERGYNLFRELVGAGCVRKMFSEAGYLE